MIYNEAFAREGASLVLDQSPVQPRGQSILIGSFRKPDFQPHAQAGFMPSSPGLPRADGGKGGKAV